MRLLDADELLKYMETVEISQSIDEINKGNDNYSSTALYGYIKEMTTAYDVDKVVERLEQQKNQYFRRAEEIKNKFGENYESQKNYGKACSYDYALKIVKSGGIE